MILKHVLWVELQGWLARGQHELAHHVVDHELCFLRQHALRENGTSRIFVVHPDKRFVGKPQATVEIVQTHTSVIGI